MFKSFIAACIAGCALSLKIKEVQPTTPSALNVILAQTVAGAQDGDVDAGICQRTFNRHKMYLPNFYEYYNHQGDVVYTDGEFPHDNSALFWDDAQEVYVKPDHLEQAEWTRAKYAFEGKSLYGTTGIRPADIKQGSIGNCWFMSAASAIAEYPGRMEQVFLNNVNEISQIGIYAVNFYTLGVPHTVIVDDFLPLKKGTDNGTLYAKVGEDGAIWGPILEKAFAKLHGNYNHITSGDPSLAIRTIYGAPYVKATHADYASNLDGLWSFLKEGDDNRDIMTCGTAGNDHFTQNAVGLAKGHAYTVQGVKEVTDANGTKTKLVRLRNPWGAEQYSGPWCDSCDEWTAETIEQTGHAEANDGVFYIPLDAYQANVAYSLRNHNIDNLKRNTHLVLNDTSNTPGWTPWCGEKCSKHEYTLKSDTEQRVWVKAQTWDERSYPKKCFSQAKDRSGAENRSGHVMYLVGGQFDPQRPQAKLWKDGEYQLDAFVAQAGVEYTLVVEWDWTNPEIPKDFSITAYGDGEDVHLSNNNGRQSDAMPHQARQGDINSPDTPTVVQPPPPPPEPQPSGNGDCDPELKDAVNSFQPDVNIAQFSCGTWFTTKTHSSGNKIVAFKNGCAEAGLSTVWTATMKKTDWDEAKGKLFEDGDNYTPLDLDSCVEVDAEYMNCDIQLKTLGGKKQDRGGFIIPATHGNLNFGAAIAFE